MNPLHQISISLVVMLLLSVSSIAQKCEEITDPITGEKVVEFKNNQQTLRYKYTGGDLVDLYLTFIYQGEQNVSIPQGSEVAIKLKNDKILQIQSQRDATPVTEVTASQYGASVSSKYTLEFKLSLEEISTLASDKISFIRYPSLDGGVVDLDIKGLGKIYAKKITNGAVCINEAVK